MSDKISCEQHYDRFVLRRESHDYHAIFMHGCCYHFALALHETYRWPLEYVPAETPADYVSPHPHLPNIGHCWALKQAGLGIDINGVHRTVVLREIYSPSCLYEPQPIEPSLMQKCLEARNYLDAMNRDAFELAHKVIRFHERLQSARPLDEGLLQDFENLRKRESE